MSDTRVFVTGATGGIGSHVIQRLVESGVPTTAFIRSEEKAQVMFADELKSGLLTLVKGDVHDAESFRGAIKGHTRLFLLVTDLDNMAKIKGELGRIAYENGVKQIVDISSYTVHNTKRGYISYAHTTGEEALLKAAGETNNNLVVLRPGYFMSNLLHNEVYSIKAGNKTRGVGNPDQRATLVHPKDIADVAVAVLLDPVEKHLNYVYDVQTEVLSNKQRAEVLSRVLGRDIQYEQEEIDAYYSRMSPMMPHRMLYDFVTLGTIDFVNPVPQIRLLTGRNPRTFEEWIHENRQAFD